MDSDQTTETDVEASEIAPEVPKPSMMKRTFRNRYGHWRAGWRFLVYAIAVFVIGKAISTPLKVFFPDAPEANFLSWTHTLVWVVGNLALLLGGLALLRFFDRRPTALLGLGFSRGWLREVVIGLAAGPVITGALAVILVLTGSVSLALSSDLRASFGAFPFYLVLFTLAAAVEEFVFRGYPLQSLAEGSRRWIAGLLLCLPFTLGHLSNPDVTMIGVANIFLASVLLVILYFQTRRLWLPIGFHLSWNLAQSWLWGFDVSGIKIDNNLFVVTPTGADLLTGGEFGLEGSILSTILFVALVVWFLVKPVLRPTAEVADLWAPYPAGFGLDPTAPPRADRAPEDESRGAAEDGQPVAPA
ncbi:MAG: CPBP family intramembrane metalloprotease [Acidobacteria bacterium]|nr:CPBP family intramembrane metalloprotease [Candidatus Sulfomarinibacter kjeldsenii]